MDPQIRKAKTEALLKKEGIVVLPSLPFVESEEETHVRSVEEVGIRIACLFCVAGTAFSFHDNVFREYLRQHDLWKHLTPSENTFLSCSEPERQNIISFTWRSEGLFLLMWSARLFDELPLPRQETATSELVAKFPGLDQSPWSFIRALTLRSVPELLDVSDLLYRLHWATRQAGLGGTIPPAGLNIGMVQEWHHAINWVTRYGDQDWDDISTDT